MFTSKYTPLLIALAVGLICLVVGYLIGTTLSLVIGITLAGLIMIIGGISALMTHWWLTDDVRLWSLEIRRFEKADKKQMPSSNAIVFVGSSTIRFWKTLQEDMSPLPVIQRGFGGSRILDAVYYADKIVIPYRPQAIVVYSGTNDIAGKLPKSADYVAEKFKEFCAKIHTQLPDTPIYYISIMPTPGRLEHWETVQDANRRIEQYTQSDSRLHYIDSAGSFFDDTGELKRELYRWDKIHLTSAGYAVLTKVVKPVLLQDFETVRN